MPTLEEVCAWAQSFDNLMVTPAGRNAFREFLRTEFSEENMLFWMACEELKREANKSTIEEKARIIYEDYISILSPKEVRVHRICLVRDVAKFPVSVVTCFLHGPGLHLYSVAFRTIQQTLKNYEVFFSFFSLENQSIIIHFSQRSPLLSH